KEYPDAIALNTGGSMPRMPIIAAIGGNGLPKAAELAQDFGTLLSDRTILMTGGEPGRPPRDVKNAALRGCEERAGRMISVLPDRQDECVRTGRRILLTTKLNSFGRDPITGAAADVVVAFPGKLGTLVELAYAALEKRPIVFCCSIECLRNASIEPESRPDLRKKLAEAVRRYSLLSTDVEQLIEALAGSF